jgi:hypothetical protein
MFTLMAASVMVKIGPSVVALGDVDVATDGASDDNVRDAVVD